jgi:outer membrane biosynthesis protein TonB
LAKDQSQALRNFVAQAEISLAEKASVSKARNAIGQGRAAGKSAICDAAAQKLVNEVLAAATAATAAPIEDTTISKAPEPPVVATKPVVAAKPVVVPEKPVALAVATPAPAPKKQVAIIKPQKPKAKVATITQPKPVKPQKTVKPVKGLTGYASVAEKYYVALRCGSMSSSRINGLYETVLSNHRQAMANNRHRDVRNMLQAAERRAGSKSCG